MSDKEDLFGHIIPIPIEEEVEKAYLDYAMSVIVARALPDARDGLKPVHRRILYAMNDIGLTSEKNFRKTAHVVGEVLAKYHPHGDQAVYDTLVRLAQDFSLRYPVVHGQGNFGSIDGDPPAAMRYTESKLFKIAEEMLKDINKQVVDFCDNYDGSDQEPTVLPSALPFLLINGTSGIAVGMATNLASHNLKEVCAAICAYIDQPNISIDQLMQHIKGPDFPTGAYIYGKKGIYDAFTTGRGKITMRSKYSVEEHGSREWLIIHEIPYTVNKAELVKSIAEQVRNKNIEDISDLRDESNREGIRIVIELKKQGDPQVVVNYLFKHTDLQKNFNVNNLVLVDGLPVCLPLIGLIEQFVKHRQVIIRRKTEFDLKKAKQREHIVEGLVIAQENIEQVIKIIRGSQDVETAKQSLIAQFHLTLIQAQAILEMRLQRLTHLEVNKLKQELIQLKEEIQGYEAILASESKILDIVKQETKDISKKFGDERRTIIYETEAQTMEIEDLMKQEDMVIVYSNEGYMKRVPLGLYRSQARGGKGSNSLVLREQDYVKSLFIANTHEHLLCFTNLGKAYWLKVYQIPEGTRNAKGKHSINIFKFSDGEYITSMLNLGEFSENTNIIMASRKGRALRMNSYHFRNAKTRGILAIELQSDDELMSALLTDQQKELIFVTKKGYALRYHEETIRSTGRKSKGVKGISLREDDQVIGAFPVEGDVYILLITQKGYGKLLSYKEFQSHGRGTKGQICYKINAKTGDIVGALAVDSKDSLVCITGKGKTIKVNIKNISIQKRATQGVKVFNIDSDDTLVDVAKAERDEEDFI